MPARRNVVETSCSKSFFSGILSTDRIVRPAVAGVRQVFMTNSFLFSAVLAILLWLWFTLGRDIRLARIARGLTQEKLAELVGVEPRSVQRWEADQARPRPGHMYRIQQMGIVDVDQIWVPNHFRPKTRYPWGDAWDVTLATNYTAVSSKDNRRHG